VLHFAAGIELKWFLLVLNFHLLMMHAAWLASAIAAFITSVTSQHLRQIKLYREEAICAVSTESQVSLATEVCKNPMELALRTVKLLKGCSEESTPSESNLAATAKIYTSQYEKYLKWDDLCADENCMAVAFCKDKVTAVADEKKENDGPTMIKSHFAVNVLTYEIARWLFLAENAVDSKANIKFEGTGAKLAEFACADWNKPLQKTDTPNRPGEDRKKLAEKANNYKFLTVKLEKMEKTLLSCFEATMNKGAGNEMKDNTEPTTVEQVGKIKNLSENIPEEDEEMEDEPEPKTIRTKETQSQTENNPDLLTGTLESQA